MAANATERTNLLNYRKTDYSCWDVSCNNHENLYPIPERDFHITVLFFGIALSSIMEWALNDNFLCCEDKPKMGLFALNIINLTWLGIHAWCGGRAVIEKTRMDYCDTGHGYIPTGEDWIQQQKCHRDTRIVVGTIGAVLHISLLIFNAVRCDNFPLQKCT